MYFILKFFDDNVFLMFTEINVLNQERKKGIGVIKIFEESPSMKV